MNNIIFKSSVCPYILEGCIVNLWNCYIGQKLTEKQDLAVFAWRDGSFQTIPTIQQGGWHFFAIFREKVWTFQQAETESNWKYYAQHAQKLNQEGFVINSSELVN